MSVKGKVKAKEINLVSKDIRDSSTKMAGYWPNTMEVPEKTMVNN